MTTEDDDGSGDISLAQAKAWLDARVEKGAKCPCCGQFAKVYRRKLNSSMAFVLHLIYRHYKGHSIHVPSLINEYVKRPEVAAAVRGDWAKLKYWNLIIEDTKNRDDKKNSGRWFLSTQGLEFVEGRLKVHRYVHIYDDEFLGFAGPLISIRDALGDRFSYAELMQ